MQKFENWKIRLIREHYLNPLACTKAYVLKKLATNRTTILKYFKEFVQIQALFPNDPSSVDFFWPKKKRKPIPNLLQPEMLACLPAIVARCTKRKMLNRDAYEAYHQLYPNGYSHSSFKIRFSKWYRENNICMFAHNGVKYISEPDSIILEKWYNGSHLDRWKKAVVIKGSFATTPLIQLTAQVQITMFTGRKWIRRFNESGIKGITNIVTTKAPYVKSKEEKKNNLMKILHETPKLHGYNRTSWRIADLSETYGKVYGSNMAATTIGACLRDAGYQFKKAKIVLTSPDPNFREKLDEIKTILSDLAEDEKFFSIDEFGPCAVKRKKGTSITAPGEIKTVQQNQKSKGWFICTAALELSTNQVTHFFSTEKNTDEMIKLITKLLLQYPTQKKLYISWDAASWHSSKKLNTFIANVNALAASASYTIPSVALAPLPSSAQFLNVIESVFSGLAKSVIHNSDYESVDECRAAIDRHFTDRNAYFMQHPMKAGKMIWGKELVKAVFDDTQNCKDPLY